MSKNKDPKRIKLKSNFDYSVEEKWYDYWQKHRFFHSEPNPNKEPYTIVIPPPNITGILHMGHVLNNTIQDILIRKARMEGKEACWIPGTDHASIATEAKVVNMLKEKGIEKNIIGREKFLRYAWEWKEKYGGIILKQLKKIGASCDWERTRFTMEEKLSKAVTNSFVQLYDEGYIYKGNRMINWDPEGKTALADDEVIHKEVEGNLFYIKYEIFGSDEHVVIATTRPETIMGDTALCVNPKDERYKNIIGKKAIIPLVRREIPIIADKYVSMEYGTGCLKVTPAHDINDSKLGVKHNLEFIDIFNDNGTLNSESKILVGLDRFEAREKISAELKAIGHLIKIENISHSVGFSERTNSVVEHKISNQWFVRMKELALPALENVLNDNIKFHPSKFKNMYKSWMENVKDWCISRQLWWGQQIPAYYLKDGTFIVAKNIKKALEKAKLETKDYNLTESDLRQDEDVLDTWFSSWLWPISVFDGFEDPNNSDIEYYYPTNDLVTAPEIIFFWVARMIIAGYKFRGEMPFKNVYFTGIVRDSKRRKMSKSLGNSPDPIELIEKYGADGIRTGMLLCAPAGNDLLFDEKLCEQGRNFTNKIWNALRLIKNLDIEDKKESINNKIAIEWFDAKLRYEIINLEEKFKKFKLSEALMIIYKLIWDDFCAWYLEMIKPDFGEPISKKTYEKTLYFFETLMKLLHPFMPFITEEVYHILGEREEKDCIIISKWPEIKEYNESILTNSKQAFELITNIRRVRREKNISPKEKLKLYYQTSKPVWLEQFQEIILNLANLSEVNSHKESSNKVDLTFTIEKTKFIIPLDQELNIEEEKDKLEKELLYYKDFLKSIMQKLDNQSFIENAPNKIVNIENKKRMDAESKIKIIENSIKNLNL